MKKLILLFALAFILVFSFFAWYELIVWFNLVSNTPAYSHIERQEIFIQEVTRYYFVSEPGQLYFSSVIKALLSMINNLVIIVLKSRLNKFIFLFLLIQGLLLMAINIWGIL